ncbi:MAG: class I mannose-6-phosphate isomerase [Roseiflexus sp.]|nr:class I mannose-6-phosphate isomerase [Roseiflexus sp.]MCS7290316.1 class I mannose-6-phosphate isomerase [Roseiflexus sp.]MDW8146070.1 class I mannose-6-phosphate isomerase [Roseiflexaceae bacterium]MDW8231268.1 class I mannose-6-phosphate isomerase [Roseiflexaceae bacterium]
MPPIDLYPLITRPRLARPLWSGTFLADWLELPQPQPERLGEMWLVYDTNPILEGPLAGQTLAQATRDYGAALVGERTIARYGADFPLLAKFIDAADRLSIQVHPDDAYAHTHETATGFHGKTEAWHILHAAPGADVVYGLARPSSRDELAAAIANGALEPLLRRLPVASNDTVFVPAGTLHAINAGIVLFEIQQKSDLTYRVYDYGRIDAATGKPRELHIEKALDVTDYAPAPRGVIPPLPLETGRDLLVACRSFALERLTLTGAVEYTVDPATFEILTVIDGAAMLQWNAGARRLRHGEAVVLPACLGAYALVPAAEVRVLRSYVPDLDALRREFAQRGMDATQVAETVIEM